ncbi:hypothetical protein SAMN05519104_7555 [Rhizobiales bacterium GAS188]|nr:hypothetical protein SAMN05519104_7555 [Rhizobiales bacterium GAS188]
MSRPPNKIQPAKAILLAGIVAFIIAAAVCLFFTEPSDYRADPPLSILVLVPILALLFLAVGSWAAFFFGTISGTPLVSITFALGFVKRNWMSFVGTLLLLSALASMATAYWGKSS